MTWKSGGPWGPSNDPGGIPKEIFRLWGAKKSPVNSQSCPKVPPSIKQGRALNSQTTVVCLQGISLAALKSSIPDCYFSCFGYSRKSKTTKTIYTMIALPIIKRREKNILSLSSEHLIFEYPFPRESS